MLFAGVWSLQKGVDILMRAMKSLPGVMLTHVGGQGDHPFPDGDPQFERIGHVPQWRLTEHYRRADVFVLASRQEGFGVVLSQALASGLPVVCTTRTGGADLVALSPELAARISLVPPDDAEALARALARALEDGPGRNRIPLPEADRNLLSWTAYGARYRRELLATAACGNVQTGSK